MRDAARPSLVCLLRSCDPPDAYALALEANGFQVVCEPVLTFTLTHREALRQALALPESSGGLILTSVRAAEAVAQAVASVDDWPGAWALRPTFVVGPRTAEAVRALGLQPVGEEGGRALALADVIRAHRFDRPLLFLCGDRRREDLPEQLHEAGVLFREMEVYQTRLRDDVDLTHHGRPDWLVFFSPSGVEAVQRSGAAGPLSARRAALGPTTAAAIDAAGWTVDAVAEAPTPTALCRALRSA